MMPSDTYVPNPQFNVAPFGKSVNITFNSVFLKELVNVLSLESGILEDFQTFVDDLVGIKAGEGEVDSLRDEQGEYGLFRYKNVFMLVVEYEFARDLALAVSDSVRLFSEGKQVHVNSVFAFSKRLESAVEGERGDSRSYMGRHRGVVSKFPNNNVVFNRGHRNVR